MVSLYSSGKATRRVCFHFPVIVNRAVRNMTKHLWDRIWRPLGICWGTGKAESYGRFILSLSRVLHTDFQTVWNSFMRSHLQIIGPNSWVNVVLFRKSFLTPMLSIALPAFSSSSLSVRGPTLRSLVHLVLVSMKAIGTGLISFFSKWSFRFFSSTCWRHCLFSSVCFWHVCILSGYSYMYSSLILFYWSTCTFCTGAILLLLLWLCGIFWGLKQSFLWLCSFSTGSF